MTDQVFATNEMLTGMTRLSISSAPMVWIKCDMTNETCRTFAGLFGRWIWSGKIKAVNGLNQIVVQSIKGGSFTKSTWLEIQRRLSLLKDYGRLSLL